MDRRSLLKMFGVAAAAAAVLAPTVGDAMPVAPRPDGDAPLKGSAIATDADIEAAQPEKTYWYYRRRRRFRRYYFRPRYRIYRRRYFRRRYWW